MNGKRPISKGELDLWRRATADVKPLAELPAGEASAQLRREPRRDEPKARARTAGRMKAPVSKPAPTAPAAPQALDPARPVGIDRRNWERLKRGQVTIERKLDLHGRTQTEAHTALNRFLTMAAAAGLRCLLVVTGKGGADGRGVLREMVPRWLAEADNRRIVLTYSPAQPRHGGDGALYVLLRRHRGAVR
ncbi:MAG: Smr/MutS family protein [Alphaproteobacteria bacterium]